MNLIIQPAKNSDLKEITSLLLDNQLPTIDINEKGTQYKDEHGNIWLEEYPTIPTSHVLNGFIYAIFGIYDLYRVTKGKNVFNVFA